MKRKPDQIKKSNDTSNSVKNIDDVSSKFKKKPDLETELINLRKFSEAQDITIQRLLNELKLKEEKLIHLEELVSKNVPVIGKVERIEHSQEEIVAEAQLSLIRRKAESGIELTLEEARKFEIFAKVKNNSKENSISPQFKNLSDNKSDLLKLAKAPAKQNGTE